MCSTTLQTGTAVAADALCETALCETALRRPEPDKAAGLAVTLVTRRVRAFGHTGRRSVARLSRSVVHW
jgi:hypothetical protein